MKRIMLIALALSIAGLSPCALAADPCETSPGTVFVTKSKSDSIITVPPGGFIRIELPALGSAGYSWQMKGFDPEYLDMAAESSRPISEELRVGAPVIMIWCIRAKKSGWTDLYMDYYRPWEGLEKATDHFSLSIDIE